MGVNRFFWTQDLLDQWIVEEKIVLDGELLTILDENRSYNVDQAVYFESDVGDGADQHNLVGRVKELAALEELGAEYYMDSVILEDSAYQVLPGFTGEPLAVEVSSEGASAEDLSGAIATHAGDESEQDDDDRELLARFLIENL